MKCILTVMCAVMFSFGCSERNRIPLNDLLNMPRAKDLCGTFENYSENKKRSLWSFLVNDDVDNNDILRTTVRVDYVSDEKLLIKLMIDSLVIKEAAVLVQSNGTSFNKGEFCFIPLVIINIVSYQTNRIYVLKSGDLLATSNGHINGNLLVINISNDICYLDRFKRIY